ncbi:MAG: ribosome-associated translation inhibitor RaiA [Deltaproteobacteria bacterium]|nr:ribosome-associated translation inhibitor RaiA [Deltaproteobacteria bacterium]
MQIDVTFRHMAPSAALRSYASDKVGRITRILEDPISARVKLSLDGFRNVAEASVHGKGTVLTASESSKADMYAAIDIISDKLAAQARRHKSRATAHRSSPTAQRAAQIELADADEDIEDDE